MERIDDNFLNTHADIYIGFSKEYKKKFPFYNWLSCVLNIEMRSRSQQSVISL